MEKTEELDIHSVRSVASLPGVVIARVASHLTTNSTADPGTPSRWRPASLDPSHVRLAGYHELLGLRQLLRSLSDLLHVHTSKRAHLPYHGLGVLKPVSSSAWTYFPGVHWMPAGYFRPTIMVGIVFQLVGIFTMSVAKIYWQLLLTQGICTGIGGGIFFVPIVGLCNTYFAKRRGLALGIVTSGNSAKGIVYPIIVRQLLRKIGFAWTVHVLDFFNIISLAVVIAFMRPRLPSRKTGPLLDMAVFKDVPYMMHVLGICFNIPTVYFVFYHVRHPILCHLESYLFASRLHLSLGTNLGCPTTIHSISLLSSMASVYLRVFFLAILPIPTSACSTPLSSACSAISSFSSLRSPSPLRLRTTFSPFFTDSSAPRSNR
jgi:hypothetical protein